MQAPAKYSQISLSLASANSRHCFHCWCRKNVSQKRSALSQQFSYSFHPSVSSPFRHSSSVIYFMIIDVKKLFCSSRPSCIYDHHPLNRCYIMHKIMYITRTLFILKLRLVVRSVLFTLHPPDLRGGKSVLTRRLIIKFTCVVCKHDGNVDRVNTAMGSMSYFHFYLFIFNRN